MPRRTKVSAGQLPVQREVANPLLAVEPVADYYDPKKFYLTKQNQRSGVYNTDRKRVQLIDIEYQTNWATALSSGDKEVLIKIPKGEASLIRKMILRFEVKANGGTAVLLPAPYWWKSFNMKFQGSGQAVIKEWFPEEYLLAMSQTHESQRESHRAAMGFGKGSWYGEDYSFISGETRYYDLELLNNPLEISNVVLNHIKSDIELRMKTRDSGVKTSGTASSISIESIQLLIEDYELSEVSKNLINNLQAAPKREYFLEAERFYEIGTPVDNTSFKIRLDTVSKCFCPFMLIMAREGSNQDLAYTDGLQEYIDFGPGASIAIRKGNKSIFEHRAELNPELLRRLAGQYLNSDLVDKLAIYPVVFGDIDAAMKGNWEHGFLKIDSSDYIVDITPQTGTAHVQTITWGGTADGGFYRFEFDGQVSAAIAFDAAVGTMKSAFEDIPAVKALGLQVTFSAAASAGTTSTATFGIEDGYVPLIRVINDSLNDGGVVMGSTVAHTTKGARGITASTSHVFEVLVFRYKELLRQNDTVKADIVYDK